MIHSVRFTCVLDTNVIYPLWIRDLMLWFAHHELYTPKWSQHIFDEWMEVMKRKRISESDRLKRISIVSSLPFKMRMSVESGMVKNQQIFNRYPIETFEDYPLISEEELNEILLYISGLCAEILKLTDT